MTPRVRILVIDDNPLVRQLLHLELTEAAYDVRTVPDGRAGIAAARECRPDAVVLDLKMPGMAGSEVFQVLQGLYPGLPVFLFTVYGDFCDRVDLSAAAGCFVKSADLTPLIAAIGLAVGPG
ncbi:MAG: response regulator [Deferrisomatales bacterium]